MHSWQGTLIQTVHGPDFRIHCSPENCILHESLPMFYVSWVITKRQYGSTRSPVPRVHVSAQTLTPSVTPSSLLPSEGLCFHVCKMGTIIPTGAAVRMLELIAVNEGLMG